MGRRGARARGGVRRGRAGAASRQAPQQQLCAQPSPARVPAHLVNEIAREGRLVGGALHGARSANVGGWRDVVGPHQGQAVGLIHGRGALLCAQAARRRRQRRRQCAQISDVSALVAFSGGGAPSHKRCQNVQLRSSWRARACNGASPAAGSGGSSRPQRQQEAATAAGGSGGSGRPQQQQRQEAAAAAGGSSGGSSPPRGIRAGTGAGRRRRPRPRGWAAPPPGSPTRSGAAFSAPGARPRCRPCPQSRAACPPPGSSRTSRHGAARVGGAGGREQGGAGRESDSGGQRRRAAAGSGRRRQEAAGGGGGGGRTWANASSCAGTLSPCTWALNWTMV